MLRTLDDRKKSLINRVDFYTGGQAKLIKFIYENDRLVLWFLKYLDSGLPSHGVCAEDTVLTCPQCHIDKYFCQCNPHN